jgi:GTP-binding protein
MHNRSMFTDQANVEVHGGRGGNGAATLRSEPYTPHGGPDGGDGAKGGDVVLEVTRGLFDLSDLGKVAILRAADGGHGSRAKRTGKVGPDLVVPVPDGTVVFDERGMIADLVGVGSRVVVAAGGRGGRGNVSLSNAGNRVPRVAEQGEDGEEHRVRLELRLVADVGLVGLPNAGKSTLLSRLTAARPKVADYPFTTLQPNLGVAGDEERYVVADVPGLVEGASEGRGLGLEFLRHVSRCRALVFVVDISAEDPAADLATVKAEVAAYQAELVDRPALIAATKADLVDDAAERAAKLDPDALAVSGTTGEGIEALAERIASMAIRAIAAAPERKPYVVHRPARMPFDIEKEGNRYVVRGARVERWVKETDMEDARAVRELQKRLVKSGVERRLGELGARKGDEVVIAGSAFEFLPQGEDPDDA